MSLIKKMLPNCNHQQPNQAYQIQWEKDHGMPQDEDLWSLLIQDCQALLCINTALQVQDLWEQLDTDQQLHWIRINISTADTGGLRVPGSSGWGTPDTEWIGHFRFDEINSKKQVPLERH